MSYFNELSQVYELIKKKNYDNTFIYIMLE